MTFAPRENRLPLPPILRDLIAAGRWRQPTDEIIYSAIPFLREPVNFLLSEDHMRFESKGQCVDLPHFHEYRGSESSAQPLPWLDDELALFIAVNREIGADIGVALDYRTSSTDPRVIASDWWTDGLKNCCWREAAATFSEFVERLRL